MDNAIDEILRRLIEKRDTFAASEKRYMDLGEAYDAGQTRNIKVAFGMAIGVVKAVVKEYEDSGGTQHSSVDEVPF